jgi:ABC-2 type transport system permease protein
MALRQARYTNKEFWRNSAAAFFTFAFPLMFLVLFGVLFGGGTIHLSPARSVSVREFYVPAIAAFSVITACYTNIAMTVTVQRDQGTLKRLHGTPLPSWAYMLGRILHSVFIAAILVAICMGFGAIFFGAAIPTSTMPAFLLTLVAGAACFTALGLAVASFIPNADSASAIVNGTILPLLFISDVFIPMQNPPAWIATIAKIFPVEHFAVAMQASYFDVSPALRTGDLLVMAAWGVAGGVLAARYFSWEPRL